LAISDIQLGQARGVSGALRNATGSTIISRESNIQLSIHFDRIARAINNLLRELFILSRERMSGQLFFRVTGENGEPIFGDVDREALKGDFDFDIASDLLTSSEQERQQRATLMLQTAMNPAFMQTGIVTPGNMYELMREYLKAHNIKRIDDYISRPPDAPEERVSPSERIFRIVVNMYDNPPIENTVRLDENHEKAIQMIEGFKQSDDFGLLTSNAQVAALERLKEAHMQMMQAQQSQMANAAGLQTSSQSLAQPTVGPQAEASPLAAPEGEARGPVA